MDKEVRQFVKRLKRQGFEVKIGKRSGHAKAYPPNGGPYVSFGLTPRCPHWRQNAERWARKALEGEIETTHGRSKVA